MLVQSFNNALEQGPAGCSLKTITAKVAATLFSLTLGVTAAQASPAAVDKRPEMNVKTGTVLTNSKGELVAKPAFVCFSTEAIDRVVSATHALQNATSEKAAAEAKKDIERLFSNQNGISCAKTPQGPEFPVSVVDSETGRVTLTTRATFDASRPSSSASPAFLWTSKEFLADSTAGKTAFENRDAVSLVTGKQR